MKSVFILQLGPRVADIFSAFFSTITHSLALVLRCLKFVRIRCVFWSVFSHIQSEYEKKKKKTEEISDFGHFPFSAITFVFLFILNIYFKFSFKLFGNGVSESRPLTFIDFA